MPTAAGTPGRQSCWGIPACRCEFLPGHHCSAAAPALGGHQVCQPEEGAESGFSTLEMYSSRASHMFENITQLCTVPVQWVAEHE